MWGRLERHDVRGSATVAVGRARRGARACDTSMSKKEETVRVCVRCRPLNSKEKADGRDRIVNIDTKAGSITLAAAGSSEPPKNFTFDNTYDESNSQEYIYQQTAARIVDSVLEGFNGTVFAYGQTGTGKTFTMEGVNDPPELKGIIPRAFEQIFESIAKRGGEQTEYLVRAELCP